MVSKVRGKFLDFEGTIMTADDPLNSSASVTVQMASINTGNERRDNHIRSSDFFEVEKHPVMSFESTGARSDDGDIFVDGELTIRGVTRPITLAVEFGGIQRDSKGRLRLGFTASGSLNRQDFGVSWKLLNVLDHNDAGCLVLVSSLTSATVVFHNKCHRRRKLAMKTFRVTISTHHLTKSMSPRRSRPARRC